MKRLGLIFGTLLLCSVFAFGQNETANYAGSWTLDVGKSELGERARVKSMTMTVTQTASEISYERLVEREEGNGMGAGMGAGMGGGGRGGMGGGMRGMFGGNQSAKYALDGKETTSQGEMGTAKLQAKFEKGVLKLTQKRTLETPMGSITINTTEKWTLSDDGKTLTVNTETATRRGNQNSKMIFTLKGE